MINRDLQELLFCALEGAARSIVAYCDASSSEKPRPESVATYVLIESSDRNSKENEEKQQVAPPPDAPKGAPEAETYDHSESLPEYREVADKDEEVAYGFELPDVNPIVVDGVPPNHPIHQDVAELLPSFRAISALVDRDDFVVTPESVEAAMPVWVSFNALSRYREDENFPAILAYVRTHIKPVCFAAMGKEVSK